jgi:hypothetical protein
MEVIAKPHNPRNAMLDMTEPKGLSKKSKLSWDCMMRPWPPSLLLER